MLKEGILQPAIFLFIFEILFMVKLFCAFSIEFGYIIFQIRINNLIYYKI